MIGRIYRGAIDGGARLIAPTGVHPNAVSLGALALGVASCALFVWNREPVLFAILMIAAGYLDTLDGAVARLTNRQTAFGAYLDAMSDRIFDSAALCAIAIVTGRWPLCMAMALGGFMVSYAKARAGMEAPISNLGWPHLMGREERVIGLALTLAAWGLFPHARIGTVDLLTAGIGLMTLGLGVTAVRRMLYAKALLDRVDA